MRLVTLSDNELFMTLIALAILLVGASIFGNLLERIKGPRVVGEILGGMFIGGSFLFIIRINKNISLSNNTLLLYPLKKSFALLLIKSNCL